MSEIDEEKINTGEWYYLDNYPEKVIRKSKDTFVFLKDYKLKIREMKNQQKNDTSNLDNHMRFLHGEIQRERNLWRLEKEELEERIKSLERMFCDLLNPPIKPKLKNPFD